MESRPFLASYTLSVARKRVKGKRRFTVNNNPAKVVNLRRVKPNDDRAPGMGCRGDSNGSQGLDSTLGE